MELRCPFALASEVHVAEVVTVAALERVVGFESRPFVLGQLTTLVEEFLARVDCAEDRAPNLLGRLHLARDLVGPLVRYVAIRTGCPYARAVAVVNGILDLHVHVVFHLVTRNAEGLRVGGFQRGVETAPEDDPGDEPAEGQRPQTVVDAGPAENGPVAFEK